jgi:hypothetical protein
MREEKLTFRQRRNKPRRHSFAEAKTVAASSALAEQISISAVTRYFPSLE